MHIVLEQMEIERQWEEFLKGMFDLPQQVFARAHQNFAKQVRQMVAEFENKCIDLLPKPKTYHERVRAMKAHPRSVRGRM